MGLCLCKTSSKKKGSAISVSNIQDQPSNDRSLYCKDIHLENGSALVLLCSVPCSAVPLEIHAIIIIEIMDDGREIYKADFNPTSGGNKICQKGEVRLIRIAEDAQNDDEIQKSIDYLKSTRQITLQHSWKVNVNKAEELYNIIKEEKDKQNDNYSLVGESCESSVSGKLRPSSGDFHNCVTWVRRMLKKAELNIDEKSLPKSWKITMLYEKSQ